MSFEQNLLALGNLDEVLEATSQSVSFGPNRAEETARSSLLVINNTKRAVSSIGGASQSVKNFKVWGPKERRAFHRITTGYTIAQYTGSRLRFITLTTSNKGRSHDLKEDAHTLIKRVRRRYTARRFEYFRVRTNEGNGVLHLIYRGPYISRSWLKAQWEDIHESWNVDIRSCQRYHKAYIVNQYLCNQDASYTRYSMSGVWVMEGALAVWRAFCKWYPNKKLELWDGYLKRRCAEISQQTLPGMEGPPPEITYSSESKSVDSTEERLYHCIRCNELFGKGEGDYNYMASGFLCYKCYPKELREDVGG